MDDGGNANSLPSSVRFAPLRLCEGSSFFPIPRALLGEITFKMPLTAAQRHRACGDKKTFFSVPSVHSARSVPP